MDFFQTKLEHIFLMRDEHEENNHSSLNRLPLLLLYIKYVTITIIFKFLIKSGRDCLFFYVYTSTWNEVKITDREQIFLPVCFNVDFFSHNTYVFCTDQGSSKHKKIIQLFKDFHTFSHTCWEKITTLKVQYFSLKIKYFRKTSQRKCIYRQSRQY